MVTVLQPSWGPLEKYTRGEKIIHIDIEPTQIGRVSQPGSGIVSDAKAALTLLIDAAQEMQKRGVWVMPEDPVDECQQRKTDSCCKPHFDNVPASRNAPGEEMNALGRDALRHHHWDCFQIAAAQMPYVFKDRHFDQLHRAILGWTIPAAY